MDLPPGFQSEKGQKNLITNSHWAQKVGVSELIRFHRIENPPSKSEPGPRPSLQLTPADPSVTHSSEARGGRSSAPGQGAHICVQLSLVSGQDAELLATIGLGS